MEETFHEIRAALDTSAQAAAQQGFLEIFTNPGAAGLLRALDGAGLLTRIIPELEPARECDQPIVHFLPVLGHSLETVAVIDWLFAELERSPSASLPVAVQTYPDLHYNSQFSDALRQHFAETLIGGLPRLALFKLAALLHDNAKPQTKQPKPGGGVTFHNHQKIGGEVARQIARRLGLASEEVDYVALVVAEHMRPGQLAALNEITPRAITRYFRDTGSAGPDVLLHVLADHMATRGPHISTAAWIWQAQWVDAMIATIWGPEQEVVRPLLTGNDIMAEFGLTPGPEIGRLLAVVGEAQANADISTRDEALALARKTLRTFHKA